VRSVSRKKGSSWGGSLPQQPSRKDARVARHTMAMRERRSEDATHLRGTRSFGRNPDGTPRPAEVAIIRELWPHILRGDSVYRWVGILNQRKVRTSMEGTWSIPGLTGLLRNPKLAGYRELPNGELERVEALEPIVSLDEHKQMCAVLDGRAAKRATERAVPVIRKYLLTGGRGILKCGVCGKPLQSKKSQTGTPGYACIKSAPSFGCGGVRIAAEPLEEQVTVEVLAVLAKPENFQRLQAAVEAAALSGETFAEEIAQTTAELRDLGAMYGRKEIGKIAFKAAESQLEHKLRQLRAGMEEARKLALFPRLDAPAALARWWTDKASVADRHDLIELLVDEIRIKPATRRGFRIYDPLRVEFIWRP
jgi:hypothetical protein